MCFRMSYVGTTGLTSRLFVVKPSPRAANPFISMDPLHGNPEAAPIAAPMLTPAALATRCTSAISIPQRTEGSRVASVGSSASSWGVDVAAAVAVDGGDHKRSSLNVGSPVSSPTTSALLPPSLPSPRPNP